MAEPAMLERQREAGSSSQTIEIAPNLPAGLVRGLRNYWYPVLAGWLERGSPSAQATAGHLLAAGDVTEIEGALDRIRRTREAV